MRLRPHLCLVLLAVSTPLGHIEAAPRKAQKVARRSVLDYFSLLPSRYFEVEHRSHLLTKDSRPIIDLKNDYLETIGDGHQPSLQVAVFRYRGRDVVAVSADHEEGYSFELLRYENLRWRNATGDLSPIASKDELHFKLPRYGTTIQVYRSNGTRLANLYWEKGSFTAEKFDPTRRP